MDSHDEVEVLARERGSALVGYAYMLTGDLTIAQDVVQDAFVRVLTRLDAGHRPAHTEAYLRRAILNGVRDGYRRRHTFLRARTRLVEPDACTPEAQAAAHVDLQRALATLSPRERDCVVLRYIDDLPIRQVATALDLREGTVKRYLSDARGRLGNVLGRESLEGGTRNIDGPARSWRCNARPRPRLPRDDRPAGPRLPNVDARATRRWAHHR